jgi:hypothetical protein
VGHALVRFFNISMVILSVFSWAQTASGQPVTVEVVESADGL